LPNVYVVIDEKSLYTKPQNSEKIPIKSKKYLMTPAVWASVPGSLFENTR